MSDPKRHHFVPQSVLKRFADRRGKLWVYNKKVPEIGICDRIPKDIFFENHLYSIIDPEGSKDVALEKAFSRIESLIHPIFERICTLAKTGLTPRLNADERSVVDQYVYYQWKRTPDSLTASMPHSDFRKRILDSIDKFEDSFRPMTEAERREILSSDTIKRLFHNVRAKVVAQPGERVLEAMAKCALAIGTVPSSKSLIMGSRPIVKITTAKEKEIGRTGVEVWMPVSSEVAIGHVAGVGEQFVPIHDTDLIRSLNVSIASQSTMFAGRSERLISSLARNKN